MTGELVRERHGRVLVARLNRPEVRNALNGVLTRALGSAIAEAESDPEIRAVVITGTGDRAFCAGMDLRDFASGGAAAGGGNDGGAGDGGAGDGEAMAGFRRLIDGEARVPVIGAANATAVAGGFELLLACDIIVASAQAQFGLPEVRRGLFAAGGGTFLGLRVPLGIALEITLTGDSIDAQRAFDLGLVNAVVAPGEVLPAALRFAERIAANGPLGVAATRELVRLGVSDHARARQRRAELQQSVFSSGDAREGALAFVEKRAPQWQGR